MLEQRQQQGDAGGWPRGIDHVRGYPYPAFREQRRTSGHPYPALDETEDGDQRQQLETEGQYGHAAIFVDK